MKVEPRALLLLVKRSPAELHPLLPFTVRQGLTKLLRLSLPLK